MRRVGQAPDAVEIGDVLVVGLGEIRPEVAILLAPDDQGRRRDRLKLGLGALRRSHGGAVVVDHRRRCALLRPRLDIAVGLLLRVRRLGVAQEVLEELPVLRAHVVLGQIWEREVEEVPGPRELAGVTQSLVQLARMGRVENGQPVHHLGVVHRRSPGGGPAPVVAHQRRGLGTELVDEIAHVVGQLGGGVRRGAVGLRRQVVAAQVGRDHAETGRREGLDLQPPPEPELREAVQQHDQRAVAGLGVVQPHVTDLGVAFSKFSPAVRHKAGRRIRRAHEDLLSRLCVVRTTLVLSLERRARGRPGVVPGSSKAHMGVPRVPPVGSRPVERKWWTLLAGCTAIFMLLLDVTIVNVALPSIERDLGADFSDLQWVIDAYALTLAGVLLAAGSLADKVGRRRVFMLGLATFTASSLACGLAPDPLFLHMSRAVQGIGAAMMFGTSLALIAQEFQGRERGTALGIWGATTAVAVSTGPLVGGALVDALSWRWIFLVNVPIGLAALVVARLRLRETHDPAASGVDVRGVALLCPALFLLVYALIRGNEEGWGSALIVGCFAASALLLVLFVVVERRAADPLLDLSLFRKPAFTGATIAGFTLSASIFSMFLYITLFFQNVLGFSPFEAGLRSASGHRADPALLAAERSAHGARAGAATARDGT